jgi:putative nucleotidyltransferase with HDIG domain
VIRSRVPLNERDIELLRAEHNAYLQSENVWTKVVRSLFFFGLNAAMFLLVTQYLYFRDADLLADTKQFCILLGLMLAALSAAWLLALNVEWRAEIIPIVIFTITIAIAYHIELALLLGAIVSFAFSVAHGYGMAEFVVLTAASSTAALMCRQIRSRTKLVSVGLLVAILIFPTALGSNYLLGQPLGWALTTDAFLFAGGAAIAGLLMTGVLPFLERIFDIQTDISLLELSDANHPLLKELVQRAPGTYNHSINVASMSEAAADSIGANGLLCRVGAYFHDVGKLRKPDYFIENQGGGQNKHDDLTPSMSTLVIIAHVKDGSEIAKKHRLPRRIIDLIEQHHGTTLVEYFFRRAEQKLQEKNCEDDEEAVLDEADFRYPGPKPQTPEAAVMMLADTVESASRTLRDPAPSRIENLVKTIAKKKIDDGQFDECQITIQQLHTIEESLIKSLNAMYHARVKYPEKELA